MARARNIKPGFFMNEDLTELPFEYRLLFIGLWTLADREGKLQDRPKRIKMELFPADNVDVDLGLSSLESHGFLERYEVDGLQIVRILKFSDHQRPHHTEKASELPDKKGVSLVESPNNEQDETEDVRGDNAPLTVKSTLSDGGNPPDSLNPDSLIPEYPPNPPAGGEEPATIDVEPKAKRERKERMTLKTFMDRCKQSGEKAISEHAPLLEYVEATGLPMDFVVLAWEVFRREHSPGGANERRLQADWRRHFMNYVSKGYYRLWYFDAAEETFRLTTNGIQEDRVSESRRAA